MTSRQDTGPDRGPWKTVNVPDGSSPGALWVRRAMLAALVLLVAAGAAGLLGLRTDSVASTDNGVELEVAYPRVSRAGLDTVLQIQVRQDGGLPKETTVAITGGYLDMFETQGFHPEPTDTSRDGEDLFLTFDTEGIDHLVVDYDAYIQPSSQVGRSATVSVVDGDRQPLVSVPIRTTLVP